MLQKHCYRIDINIVACLHVFTYTFPYLPSEAIQVYQFTLNIPLSHSSQHHHPYHICVCVSIQSLSNDFSHIKQTEMRAALGIALLITLWLMGIAAKSK